MNVIPDSTGFDSFGTGPAGASSAYIYLSDDAGITTADTFLGSIDIPPLGASKIQQNLATVSLPPGETVGTHLYIGVIADGNNEVTESNENNNNSQGELIIFVDTTAPVEPQSTLPVSIGGTASILHTFLYSYDDVSGPDQVTYTVVTAPIHGTLLLNGSATTTFTQADIDNGLVQYREDGDVATSDGFTFTVSDAAGNHITDPFEIAIVNTTAPVIHINTTLSAPIGGLATIWTNSLSTVALGDEPTQTTYTVQTAAAHGTLLVNGAPANSFTQAEIDDHRVQYRASGDGATSDGFTFQATDAAGDQTSVTAFNIALRVPLLDLSDISFGASTTLGYSANGDNTGATLTVSDGTHTANLALLGQYAASGFAAAPAQRGGTIVAYAAVPGSGDANFLAVPQH